MLDGLRLRVCQQSHAGSLLADLPSADSRHGLDQVIADPDLQHLFGDVHVDAGPAAGLPRQNCRQDTEMTPFAPTLRATHPRRTVRSDTLIPGDSGRGSAVLEPFDRWGHADR